MNELLAVEVGQSVTINDVVVSDGNSEITDIQQGRSDVSYEARLDNSKVPEWWARHVNNGERSTIVAEADAAADVGFTRFDVPVDGFERTVQTDVLASLNSEDSQSFSYFGMEMAVVHSTSASWGTATTEETPVSVTVDIENTADMPITVESIDYAVSLNSVTVGDGNAPESYTLDPGERRELTFTITLDSQKMDEWWVSHVRNDETSTMTVDASATVGASGQTKTVALDSLTTESTIETDFLGVDES
jgi:LEA14-like dessication related protein